MTHEFLAYQIIIGIFLSILILRAFIKFVIGKKPLHETLVSIFIWMGMGLISLYPNLTQTLADILGFELGINAILVVTTILLFFIALSLIVKTDKSSNELTKLVRELALQDLEKYLK